MDKYASKAKVARKERPRVFRKPCCYDRLGNAKQRWRSEDEAASFRDRLHPEQEVYACRAVKGTYHLRTKRT